MAQKAARHEYAQGTREETFPSPHLTLFKPPPIQREKCHTVKNGPALLVLSPNYIQVPAYKEALQSTRFCHHSLRTSPPSPLCSPVHSEMENKTALYVRTYGLRDSPTPSRTRVHFHRLEPPDVIRIMEHETHSGALFVHSHRVAYM